MRVKADNPPIYEWKGACLAEKTKNPVSTLHCSIVQRLRGAYNQRTYGGASRTVTQERQYSAVIADDHEIVRSGLSMAFGTPGLIETHGIEVLAAVGDGLSAIAAAKTHNPSLVLVDAQMPHASGVEVVVEIRRWCPDSRIVVFTGVTSPGLISQLVEAGVDGLFSKSGSIETLYDKIPHILRGGRFVEDRFIAILETRPEMPELTGRERQTLNMIVRGKSNKEIAAGFGLSTKTVEKHRTSLMHKLGVNSIAKLLARAMEDGLIDPSKEI